MSLSTEVQPKPAAQKNTRHVLSKVPEVVLYFWIIKVLATTVGETAADFLSEHLKLGLTTTTIVMSLALASVLYVQFRKSRYIPRIYWLAVVLISVVGTLLTDNLTDRFNVSLKLTTPIFAVVLCFVFGFWYRSEKTLSMHSIYTRKREMFYWLAILFTFALGTAAGDLVAESFKIGYWQSALLFAGAIALVALLHFKLGMNAVASFWLAYILTRPLGASIGDYLSQPRGDGGLGLGTTVTSAIFLGAILLTVVYLSRSHNDEIPETELETAGEN